MSVKSITSGRGTEQFHRRDTVITACKNVLINAIDQRAVEIEQKRGTGGSLVHVASISAEGYSNRGRKNVFSAASRERPIQRSAIRCQETGNLRYSNNESFHSGRGPGQSSEES